MYLNYLRGLEGHGKSKIDLPKPIEDHGDTKGVFGCKLPPLQNLFNLCVF